MRCPMCDDAALVASHRHGIEVDVCPRCKGLWLDRGELEKILEALDAQLDAGAATAVPPPPAPGASTSAAPPPSSAVPPWKDPAVLSDLARLAAGHAAKASKASKGKSKGKKHKNVLAGLLDDLL